MAIRIPTDQKNKHTITHESETAGTIWMTKNLNLDERGIIKLSPRTVTIVSEDDDAQFDIPVGFGRSSSGAWQVMTQDQAFNGTISTSANTWTENNSSDPSGNAMSYGAWFNALWHASTDTAVLSKAAAGAYDGAWTSRITGLTSGKRHYIAEFTSRRTICVTNGNVVKQYDTSYSASTDLTIPASMEAIGLAYNNSRMAVVARDLYNGEAHLFYWDGATTSAVGYGLGSDSPVGVCAHQASFAVLTRSGRLLYFNGGGFTELANFPFWYADKIWGDGVNLMSEGNVMIADGDVIYLNLGLQLNAFGKKREFQLANCPSGVWCYDPKVGLYHRWSPSISKVYVNTTTGSNINPSTDLFTLSSGTIPATGNPCRISLDQAGVTGIKADHLYYIIKVSATTFRLATTKANALNNSYIDITAVTTGGNNVAFYMYDLVDYGCTTTDDGLTGSIALTGNQNALYRDIIFGGSYPNTSLTDKDSACIAIPDVENRGYFITPKIFSSQVTDTNQKLFVKFRPLKTEDSIVIKYRDEDVIGLPTSSPNSFVSTEEFIWTSPLEGYTDSDLSEAKTYFDAGNELEIEFLAGVGGGCSIKIQDLDYDSSTARYTLVLAEAPTGASAALKSHFLINNWTTLRTITSSDDTSDQGYAEIPLEGKSKFIQFKVEMRGSDVAIEEIGLVNGVNKPMK